jgi:hypothetical protein
MLPVAFRVETNICTLERTHIECVCEQRAEKNVFQEMTRGQKKLLTTS